MDKCNAKELLKSHKLKVTKQRTLLLDQIINIKGVFTVASLLIDLESYMDQATIYRIVNIFCEKGLIREILTRDDSKKYELSCIHNPIHPHFHCNKCGKTYCLKALGVETQGLLEQSCKGFNIESRSIQFSGICKICDK